MNCFLILTLFSRLSTGALQNGHSKYWFNCIYVFLIAYFKTIVCKIVNRLFTDINL